MEYLQIKFHVGLITASQQSVSYAVQAHVESYHASQGPCVEWNGVSEWVSIFWHEAWCVLCSQKIWWGHGLCFFVRVGVCYQRCCHRCDVTALPLTGTNHSCSRGQQWPGCWGRGVKKRWFWGNSDSELGHIIVGCGGDGICNTWLWLRVASCG